MTDRIGKYAIRREIGRGGMAVVYEADDPDLRRPVALKVIAETPTSASAVVRLRREAEIAARLRHPHIVPVHDVGQAPGPAGTTLHFIAMDLVEGRTLQHAIGDPDALRLLEEAAHAAGYAHAAGVIHRDLKPANILVDAHSRALLADFGLARGEDVRLTREGAVLGTPIYMAPEQIEGRRDAIGPRTDVYALGVILYEILAGRPPFMAATAAEIYAQVLSSEPPRIPGVDPDLDLVCRTAMAKDPAQRYPDGEAFAQDLARARRGDPLLASRPGLASRIAHTLRRRRATLAGLALLIAIVVAASFVVSSRRTRAFRDHLQRAERAEGDGRLEEARDAFNAALSLVADPAARLGAERVSAALTRRDEARSRELLAARDRMEAQQRAARLLEQGRPALDRALALTAKPDGARADIVREASASLELFRRAENEAPEYAQAPYLIGRALDALGDPDGAEIAWRRAVELDPAFGPARFLLGRSFLVRAFLEEGYHRTRPAAEIHAARAAEAFEAAMRSGSGFDDEVLRVAARAMTSYVRGDRPGALRVVSEVLPSVGSRAEAADLHWVGALAAAPADAIAHFDRCLALSPQHAAALLGRGLACVQMARFADAERDFLRTTEIWPRSRDAWNCLGTARHARGQVDTAIAAYTKAIEIDPDFVHAISNRGRAHALRREQFALAGRLADAVEALDAAMRDYDRAIQIAPDMALPRIGRGALRMAAGRVEEALADFNESLRLDPGNGDALVNRALARRTLGDPDGALRDLDACLQKHPHHVGALQQRSSLRFAMEDLDGAIADLDTVLTVSPSATAYHNRGAFRLMKGRPQDAIDDFSRALERQPGYVDALYNRALARMRLEQWQGVIDDATAALDAAPGGWKSRDQAERLRELARARLGKP